MTSQQPRPRNIDYVFIDASPFSLALADSDFTQNQVLLDPLVGTLVKYGPTGSPEPYLAESWQVLDDGLTYSFKLRRDLACTDGYPLTPQNFVSSLTHRLIAYSKKTQALEFEKLHGWKAFASNHDASLLGLHVDEAHSSVILKFDRRPDDLLNFLRMPYFGFYSPAAFRGDDNDRFKIVSCGAFELAEANDSKIVVRKRKDWAIHGNGDIEQVSFTRAHQIPISPQVPTIVDSKLTDEEIPSGFFKVQGTPISFVSMIQSPRRSLFSDKQIRQWFAHQIRRISGDFSTGIESLYPVSSFFQDIRPIPPELPNSPNLIGKKAVVMIGGRLPNLFQSRIRDAIASILKAAGADVEFVSPDLSKPDLREKFFANALVDIRVNGVAVSPYFYPSVFRMMFCSQLGISFPDPNDRICKLIDDFESDAHPNEEEYRDRLTKIVEDEGVVIPLARTRLQWLYSNHFDSGSVMPIPNYPRFELLRLKSE